MISLFQTVTTSFSLCGFLYIGQINESLTDTHMYTLLLIKKKKKTPVWGVPSVGKKGGKKWDGLMRKQGVAEAHFSRQRNLLKTKTRICMWDKVD